MNRKQKGFSLIELLIVVAIILIIAAIAIPNLLRARMAANEASAVGSLKAILTANTAYNTTYGVGYAPLLSSLGGPTGVNATCTAAELIDEVLAGTNPAAVSPQKSGYAFTYGGGLVPATVPAAVACAPGWADGFTVIAMPISGGTTGQSSFCVDGSGVVRKDPTGAAPAAAAGLCPAAMQPLQ